jgi:hypothetical protein
LMADTCPFSMDKALGQILPKSFVSLTVRRAVISSLAPRRCASSNTFQVFTRFSS